ncbi:unnamed protein product [Toxocara canis]|uniref:LTD domain-containing protein n=1 Tax=Toxocara canis TaxID=6265 RepID=A0A183U3P6_TOXCA|nr:unnamed protein product [Toxocara canis]
MDRKIANFGVSYFGSGVVWSRTLGIVVISSWSSIERANRARSGLNRGRDVKRRKLQKSTFSDFWPIDSLRLARADAEMHLEQRNCTITRAEQKLARLRKEYEDLEGLSGRLDVELQSYQNLLDDEESRLNVSRESMSVGVIKHAHSGCFECLRRNTLKESTQSNCDVEIESRDIDGDFIKLVNRGNEIVSIGRWMLKTEMAGKETVFKFHPRQTISSGAAIPVRFVLLISF